MSDFRPCLLIPVYNHGTLFEATWQRLRALNLPCIVIDDGSDTSTATVLNTLADNEPLITLLRLSHNSGKGAAVLRGIAKAQQLNYTHALQIDADGQHSSDDIPDMLALAEKNPTALISGAPQYGPDIPKARLYGRYITHFWVWIETLSFDIVDSMCGFRVYPVATTHALAQRVTIGQRMTFDTDIMVRLYREGTPVQFLPTHVSYPANGISHFRPLRDNLDISWMHTRLTYNMLCSLPQLLWKKFTAKHSETHWSQQRERGSVWGMRFCLWCYRTLGKRALHVLLYPIIGWFFYSLPTHAANRGAICNACCRKHRLHAILFNTSWLLVAPLSTNWRHGAATCNGKMLSLLRDSYYCNKRPTSTAQSFSLRTSAMLICVVR